MTIVITVNQLREALKPLFGLAPIQIQILPCPPYPTSWPRPRPDIADIVGLRLCDRTGTATIEVQRPHDC